MTKIGQNNNNGKKGLKCAKKAQNGQKKLKNK